MSGIEIEYKGTTIHFREGDDVWHADAFGEDAKLSVIKTKIDEASKVDRRLGIDAINLTRSYRTEAMEITEVVIVMECADNDEARAYRSERVWVEPRQGPKKGKKSRDKISVTQLYRPDQRDDLLKLLALDTIAREAQATCDAAKLAIPTLSLKALREMKVAKADEATNG